MSILPNYENRSIVNLMSSVIRARGGKSKYNDLHLLQAKEIKNTKNVVLFVIDALGMNSIQKNSFFDKKCIGKITSVFPSTTTTAITTIATGLAPQEHGLTGWYMLSKEFGQIIMPLPFRSRMGYKNLGRFVNAKHFYGLKSVAEIIKTKSYALMPEEYANSDYTNSLCKPAKIFAIKDFDNCLKLLKRILDSRGKKFVFVYTTLFDDSSHKWGVYSKKNKLLLKKIEKKIEKFHKQNCKTEKKKSSIILITGDHGQINTPKSAWIDLSNDEELNECLSLPLTGEPRVAYAYIKFRMAKKFLRIVRKKYSKYLTIHTPEELIKKRYFGLFKPNKKLLDRLGDFVLIAKKNYVLQTYITLKGPLFLQSNHSGLSREEMLVPLIVLHI